MATAAKRRFKLMVVGSVIALALMAPAAWAAHSVIQGTTFYSDGSRTKTISAGQPVSIFANGAKPSTNFWIGAGAGSSRADGVGGGVTPAPPCGTEIQFPNGAQVVSSTAQGDIPLSQVTMSTPGIYRVCFYEAIGNDRLNDPTATVTRPVTLEVL
ncbi:MAG: hypothetical protein ABR540_11720 [Acidimicrobiales bacterium]|nr:hypothetical protein [Actinomycetota bacterium]